MVVNRSVILVMQTINRLLKEAVMGQIPSTAWRMPVTVDVVALTIADGQLNVLLVDRGIEPYQGQQALPGGFVLEGEGLEAAARRELAEETSLRPSHLEQLRSYGPLGRDPRGPVLTVAHLVVLPTSIAPCPGGDAGAARWTPVESVPDLAFDHTQILADGVERLRAKLEYSPLATAFCAEVFTIADLRAVYEAVWGVALEQRNFHRKITGTPGFLEATGELRTTGPGRPAELFRRVPGLSPWAAVLYPPILRPTP